MKQTCREYQNDVQNETNDPNENITDQQPITPSKSRKKVGWPRGTPPRKSRTFMTPPKKELIRKRKATLDELKKNIRKKLRMSGKEYVSQKGKPVLSKNGVFLTHLFQKTRRRAPADENESKRDKDKSKATKDTFVETFDLQPVLQTSCSLEHMWPRKYIGKQPITLAKKKDLLNLCKTKVIPAEYHRFYKDLPANGEVPDNLPDPDVEEEEQDSDK
ncbi:unnamed protein product [Mytilus coruscus]|uniref:Uncharacterized protein n=1 Tax=Mytilus coruscus TaxID=42192 RepID=A0A6J8B0K3_MYTCO|nr:unnamed protein product [Mytilus coruscus]